MTSIDPYRVTDTLDDAVLDTIVTRLEVRGRHPVFVRMMDEYLDAMGIDDAKAVIDLGCGTGLASRHIARRPGFSGHITGIDQSPFLIGAANRFADDENLAGHIDFRIGDTQRLDLGAGEFDAVVAHTLISHVEHPAAVLAEIVRIAKPGSSIGIFDGDYASLTFGHPDPDQGKRDDEALIAAIVTNPRVMRQMPVLVHEAGLELVASFPPCPRRGRQGRLLAPGDRVLSQADTHCRRHDRSRSQRLGRSLDTGIGVGPLLRRQQLLRIRSAEAGRVTGDAPG